KEQVTEQEASFCCGVIVSLAQNALAGSAAHLAQLQLTSGAHCDPVGVGGTVGAAPHPMFGQVLGQHCSHCRKMHILMQRSRRDSMQ
ncbi:hypothetical protein PENTCL1PPCAC_29035, partial [Pristionchus entomophagus]